MFCMLSLQRAVAREMEKGRVYLTPRDSVGKERVDWDGLVNDVFKQEVDHFYIECEVQSLYIQQRSQDGTSNKNPALLQKNQQGYHHQYRYLHQPLPGQIATHVTQDADKTGGRNTNNHLLLNPSKLSQHRKRCMITTLGNSR